MNNIQTLTLNKEYKRAYYQGVYKAHPFLVTYLVKNRCGHNRIGITTSKKIGKAVQRNRCRRIIRASYLQIKDEIRWKTNYDIVFVARDQTVSLKTTDLVPVMKKQIQVLMEYKGRRKGS